MNINKPWLKFYEKGVPETVVVPEYSLSEILTQSANKYPQYNALIYFDKPMTFKKLDKLATKFAKCLLSIGLKEGDKVAIQLPNCPQFAIAYYGILRAGCIVIPVNPLYVGKDLEFILKDSEAKVILTFSKNYKRLNKIKNNTFVETIIVTNIKEYFPKFLKLAFSLLKERKEGHRIENISKDTITWKQFLKKGKGSLPKIETPHNALAVLQYTGGTTGAPKGAMLSNYNLVANVWQLKNWLTDLKEGGEIFIAALPFFHIYGMTTCLNLPIAIGAQTILFPQVDIKVILKAIDKYRVTIFPGIPAIYSVLSNVKEIGRYDLSSIKVCVSGAAPLPKDVKEKFEKLTGAILVEGYGLTESSPVTHCNPIYGKQKEAIGIPLPNTDSKIVDIDNGHDLETGQTGELAIKGPQVMKGYYKAFDTDTTIKNGWLLTGDIAYMDEDGYFHIVDRKKDLIITSGLNVYPKEVEDTLIQLDGVKEVVVVGKHHKTKGEIIAAFIVKEEGTKITEKDLKIFAKKELPPYKQPRSYVFVEDIPKTLIGKPLRRELKDRS